MGTHSFLLEGSSLVSFYVRFQGLPWPGPSQSHDPGGQMGEDPRFTTTANHIYGNCVTEAAAIGRWAASQSRGS